MAPHSSTLAWKNPMGGGAWWAIVHGVPGSQTQLSDFHFHFGASLVAHSVKNLPAVQETRLRSLGWEDPLEKEMATHSSILCLENLMDTGAWWAAVHGVSKSRARLSD